jgi:hypothetical protein
MLCGFVVASQWQPLLLNPGETSLTRSAWNRPGFVITKARPILTINELLPRNRRSRQKHRGASTHAAIIADNVEVQKALPQVFLASGKLMSELAATHAMSNNVKVRRWQIGWNTGVILARIMNIVDETLAPWRATQQPIFFLDGALCHLASDALDASEQAGTCIAQIPARLTWLLQPCETMFSAATVSC